MDKEATLLAAIGKLDQKALIEVFDQFAPRLFRYTLRMTGDPIEADDIVAEVFKKLLERLKTCKGPRINLQSYLYQMAYHEIVDKAREKRHIADLEDALTADQEEQPPELQSIDERNLRLVSAILEHLTEDQRHVIAFRFFEELSIKETAIILGKTTSNVKVIQNRAIAKLHQVME